MDVPPGGKIEPGESPEDAAVRETIEETGLRARATGVIGSRIHPRTGVPIVYVAAATEAEAETEIRQAVADFDPLGDHELTELRWVSPAEADDLMDGAIYDPVRRHLRGRSVPDTP